MKNGKKTYLLIEAILGILVLALALMMFRERETGERYRVSVVIPNSEDNQWAAFKYGLKMAAEDQGIELSVVSTGNIGSKEEERELIEEETALVADGLILLAVPGGDPEELLSGTKIPAVFTGEPVEEKNGRFASVEPDHYGMGVTLGEELLKDYGGRLEGKTLGFVSAQEDSEAAARRMDGVLEALEETGIEVLWHVEGSFEGGDTAFLEAQEAADFVVALDDSSMEGAGACAAANDLHGALIYGMGDSTEAVYYLDTGRASCLVVPDGFQMGYQCMTLLAQKMDHYFYKMEDLVVPHRAIRRDNLFSRENQDMLFTMSQ